jgi:hypothetical protein
VDNHTLSWVISRLSAQKTNYILPMKNRPKCIAGTSSCRQQKSKNKANGYGCSSFPAAGALNPINVNRLCGIFGAVLCGIGGRGLV